jgi:hypothetical protein
MRFVCRKREVVHDRVSSNRNHYLARSAIVRNDALLARVAEEEIPTGAARDHNRRAAMTELRGGVVVERVPRRIFRLASAALHALAFVECVVERPAQLQALAT